MKKYAPWLIAALFGVIATDFWMSSSFSITLDQFLKGVRKEQTLVETEQALISMSLPFEKELTDRMATQIYIGNRSVLCALRACRIGVLVFDDSGKLVEAHTQIYELANDSRGTTIELLDSK